ncbi:uncharacterized protein LOC116300872 [Actinia tenebrosa]|uniref:Uncharacterized protein LOC116300872 n=1 Tax=Actinia tenebrosa TaxID=6105 RepID=A0A6P8IG68_ACTTE|nr:uncharacterized protein LOC116300872 [Actinia tenebrosa]
MLPVKSRDNNSPVVQEEDSQICNNIRIFLCGAHSVGKTTLAKEIVKETNVYMMTEIARKIIRDKGMKREDFEPKSHPEKFFELQRLIIEAQAKKERENDEVGLNYVSDRGIDPVVYASLYIGKEAADRLLRLSETKEIIRRYQSSLVFVIKPFPECIVEDGVRLRPNINEMNDFTTTMENLLYQLSIPYTIINVLDLKERVKIVQSEINKRQKSTG